MFAITNDLNYWVYVVAHAWMGTVPLLMGVVVIIATFNLSRARRDRKPPRLAQVIAGYFGGAFVAMIGVCILLLVGSGCC